jgi:hypothetical protein
MSTNLFDQRYYRHRESLLEFKNRKYLKEVCATSLKEWKEKIQTDLKTANNTSKNFGYRKV